MTVNKCPGPNRSDLNPDDIFTAPCPSCGADIEFWKDDIMAKCPSCGVKAPNPRKAPA
jgi:predicted RNA-binding Zn-ribbon protein involved in translation (DUF1610 family)